MTVDLRALGQPQPAPPILVEGPGGEKMILPQCAVTVVSDQVAAGIINGVSATVLANMFAELERRGAVPPAPPTGEKPDETDAEFLARVGTDATLWAQAYVAVNGGNVDTLTPWFANAIEHARGSVRTEDTLS